MHGSSYYTGRLKREARRAEVSSRRGHTDRGDTLVEVLVAVVIIGLTVSAILGALLTSINASTIHRNSTNFDADLASFVETARNSLEFQPYNGSSSGPSFTACANQSSASSAYKLIGQPIPKSGPPGTVVAVLGTGYSPIGSPNGTFSGTFNGSATTMTAINSSLTGDIAQFTIPAGTAAGTYSITPFDGTHTAASQFTVTSATQTAGVAAFNTFDTFNLAVNYWNGGWTSTVAQCASGNPNLQQLKVTMQDNQPNNGAGSIQTIVVTNLSTLGVPAPPVINSVTTPAAVAQEVQLAWFAPAFQGSSAVTGYNVYCSTTAGNQGAKVNAAALTSTSYNDTSCNGSPLANGTNYYFEVTAINTVGESQPSTQSSAPTDPGVPASPTATPGSGQVVLNWTAPANGNAPITGYDIYCSTTSGVQGSLVNSSPVTTTSYTDTTCPTTTLVAGTTYYYEITAVNAGAAGPATAQLSATTYPGAPTGLTVTPGSGQFSLSWTAPSPNGNSPVTGYNVYCSTTLGMQGNKVNATPIATTSYTDTTCPPAAILSSGTTYYFEVTAINASGEGLPSSQVGAQIGAPSAPTSFTGSSSHSGGAYTVTLSWSAPTSAGGSPILSYNIYRSTTPTMPAAPFASVAAPGTYPATYPDSTVAHNTTYYYWVTAVNSNGEGPAAGPFSIKP